MLRFKAWARWFSVFRRERQRNCEFKVVIVSYQNQGILGGSGGLCKQVEKGAYNIQG